MSTRLPKKFWRVMVLDGGKIGLYERGSKTYAAQGHAEAAKRDFDNRGIACEIWESQPIEWTCIATPAPPKDMDPLF